MTKRRSSGALYNGIVIFFLIFVLSGCGSEKDRFPVWKDARTNNAPEGISISFLDIQYEDNSGDAMIEVLVENKGVESVAYGRFYWVEFYEGDEWHTVFEVESTPAIVDSIGAGSSIRTEYRVPSNTFSESGNYRLMITMLGSCEFPFESVSGANGQ